MTATNDEQKGGTDGLGIRRGRLTAPSAEAAFDIMKVTLQRIAKAPAWGAPERWEVTPFEVRDLARETLESIEAVDQALSSNASMWREAVEAAAVCAETYGNNHPHGPAITHDRHRRDIATAIRSIAPPAAVRIMGEGA